MTKAKRKKEWLFLAIMLLLVFLCCGCGSKDMANSKTGDDVSMGSSSDGQKNATLSLTPTVCPGIPPYYVMIDGTLMQIKEEVEEDFSEYQVGTVTYTGDLFKLPEEDGQSNYSEYDGCVYALKDGAWYMYCCTYWIDGSWCKLGPDE